MGPLELPRTLTCPECCYDGLEEIKKNVWKCLLCGTEFDFEKLRGALNKLASREFTEDFIQELLISAKPKRYPKFGERGWKWSCKLGVLYTLDVGNTWHFIIKDVPTRKCKKLPKVDLDTRISEKAGGAAGI